MVPHALARRRKVLKSGCEVEEIAHRTAERLERAVTVNAAWRLAILLGRETPELPAEVMFSDVEIGVLRDFAADRKLPEPLDLSAAVLTMAMGYRKHDGPPGYKMIWAGNSRLTIMAQANELRNRVAADEPHQQLRSDKLATKGKGAPPASAREGPATTPLAGAKLDLPGDLFSVFRARLAADGGIPQKPGKRGARPRL